MTVPDYFVARAIEIAGSTFALGVTLGWILAALQFGISSKSIHPRDRDED